MNGIARSKVLLLFQMQATPYLRSSLARALYQRFLNDQQLQNLDKSKWYQCDMTCMHPDVAEKFVLNHSDEETEQFLSQCFRKSDSLMTQLFHLFAKLFLSWFMTKTSINGFLGRGSMFVYSNAQFENLLQFTGGAHRTLLDIGAGDGKVTDIMAPHFSDVYVTELSPVMQKILSSKGYKLLGIESWSAEEEAPSTFDVISCLNVLDRCDNPLKMLSTVQTKLKPETGLYILALVLPLKQYVETGGLGGHQPTESIHVEGSCFEEQVTSLSTTFFPDNGFQVLKWTRVPYLCEGDINQSFYWLDDVVFVLRPSAISTPHSNS